MDALLHDLCLIFLCAVVHQIPFLNRLIQLIGKGGNAPLQIKNTVCIAVNFLLRRGRHPQQHSVKILENILVFFVNAPVALIHDDQVKMPRRKQPAAFFSLGLVNGIHHGGVGGKYHPALFRVVFIVQQAAQRQIRQQISVAFLRLPYQGFPICQKQDIFHIIVTAQDIHQADADPGFSRTRGLHDQHPPVFFSDGVADCRHRLFLIGAVGDLVIDLYRIQRFPAPAAIHVQLQFFFRKKPGNSSSGVLAVIVCKLDFKSVCRKNKGPLVILFFQTVRI